MRELVARARVGRLSTVGAGGHPHAVPVCYALRDQTVYSAVDHKPKRGRRLRRLTNLAETGRACLLVDEYGEDWSRLWWVRLDGPGRVVADPDEAAGAVAMLVEKYPQYRDRRPEGPVLALDIDRWRGWSAGDHGRPLAGGPLTGGSLTGGSLTGGSLTRGSLADSSSAERSLVERLDLSPHPEGGWFRETWRSTVSIQPPGYPGPRSVATAIYFLLHPDEESRWHVVRSPELWLWHRGGPLTLRLGGDGDLPAAEPDQLTLGPDLAAGAQPQVLVPAGVWQAAAPAGAEPVLVSCVVAPGFDPADFRLL